MYLLSCLSIIMQLISNVPLWRMGPGASWCWVEWCWSKPPARSSSSLCCCHNQIAEGRREIKWSSLAQTSVFVNEKLYVYLQNSVWSILHNHWKTDRWILQSPSHKQLKGVLCILHQLKQSHNRHALDQNQSQKVQKELASGIHSFGYLF